MTTSALKKAYASAPAGELIIETLELKHPKFSQTWYLCSNVFGFNSSTGVTLATFRASLENKQIVTFTPLPFSVKLPPSDAQGGQLLDITIANAGLEMMAEIEAASTEPETRIEVVYRVFLESDKTAPQSLPIRLSLDAIVVTDEAIKAQAGRSDVLNFKFPNIIYTAEKFPGLSR